MIRNFKKQDNFSFQKPNSIPSDPSQIESVQSEVIIFSGLEFETEPEEMLTMGSYSILAQESQDEEFPREINLLELSTEWEPQHESTPLPSQKQSEHSEGYYQ